MDASIKKEIERLKEELESSAEVMQDPVALLMLTAVSHQVKKLEDEMEEIPERVTERLAADFLPPGSIEPVPALCLVKPSLKSKRDIKPHEIPDNVLFTYKSPEGPITYTPLFKNLIVPYENLLVLSPSRLKKLASDPHIEDHIKGHVWVGIKNGSEISTLRGVSFLIKNSFGLMPVQINLCQRTEGPDGSWGRDLMFSDASHPDSIPLSEPFDARQMSPTMVNVFTVWRNAFREDKDRQLLVINDPFTSRDEFKPGNNPFVSRYIKYFESSLLSEWDNYLWLDLDFGEQILPEDIDVEMNIVAVVNVNINTVTLTSSSPVARLNKEGSQFVSVLETPLKNRKLGYPSNRSEFTIRDFDTDIFKPGRLYREVRRLYNNFIDDYYAFTEFHGLKDGESLKTLREVVNKIGEGADKTNPGSKRYEEGVYAMKNLSSGSLAVKVTYLTTLGSQGNLPQTMRRNRDGEWEPDTMENKKDAALEKDIPVVCNYDCGRDKAKVDEVYELLRYHSMTRNRLFTKMDIEAYTRVELMKFFGKSEKDRMEIQLSVMGAPGFRSLHRALYVKIYFKDKRNCIKAMDMGLDKRLTRGIEDHSCLSMPVIVILHSLEK
ncbi:MAG: hypothetical protein J1D77_00940 [Muribaculaceae bacterium]|nr:hypothetical protein [Muribaculaceae bacterium]